LGALAGCDNGTTSTDADVLDGTAWEITITEDFFGDGIEYTLTTGIIFNSPNMLEWYNYTPEIPEVYINYAPKIIKGTYTVSGNDLTLSLTSSLPELEGLPDKVYGVIDGDRLIFAEEGEGSSVYIKQY
jgi:hypothetical protein